MRAHLSSPTRLLVSLALLSLPAITGCAASQPAVQDCSACVQPAPTSAAAAAPKDSRPPIWPDQLDHASTPGSHRQAVYDLLESMNMEEVLQISLDQAIQMQMQINPDLARFEGVMRKFMGKYLSLEGLREPLTDLYVDRFSELEIVQLTAFYRTPLGQRTLVELPKLMEEGGKLGLKLVQDHMDELMQMLTDEMRKGKRP
ncbi:MAG: DUF2059 domain-containing protein [Polyangiaceae bacterium]